MISRTFGGTEWRVSHCFDGVVVVAPPTGHIAAGSCFMFSRPNGGGAHELAEQTPSPGTPAHAAYLELRALNPLEVAALIAAVKVNACSRDQGRSCNPPRVR